MEAEAPGNGTGDAKAMGKKGVPEWLNSSLWASSSSPPASASTTAAARLPRSPPSPKIVAPARAPIPKPPPPPRPPQPPSEAPRPSVDAPPDDRSPSRLSQEEVSRQFQLLAELSKKVVNIGELRRLASQGIPDGTGIRSIVWKLLLGYLPYEREFWMQELAKKRSQYKAFKEEFLMNPVGLLQYSVF